MLVALPWPLVKTTSGSFICECTFLLVWYTDRNKTKSHSALHNLLTPLQHFQCTAHRRLEFSCYFHKCFMYSLVCVCVCVCTSVSPPQSSRGRAVLRLSATALAPPAAPSPVTLRATALHCPPTRASPSASSPPDSPRGDQETACLPPYKTWGQILFDIFQML